jgi:hypothetical protein
MTFIALIKSNQIKKILFPNNTVLHICYNADYHNGIFKCEKKHTVLQYIEKSKSLQIGSLPIPHTLRVQMHLFLIFDVLYVTTLTS